MKTILRRNLTALLCVAVILFPALQKPAEAITLQPINVTFSTISDVVDWTSPAQVPNYHVARSYFSTKPVYYNNSIRKWVANIGDIETDGVFNDYLHALSGSNTKVASSAATLMSLSPNFSPGVRTTTGNVDLILTQQYSGYGIQINRTITVGSTASYDLATQTLTVVFQVPQAGTLRPPLQHTLTFTK